MSLKTTDRTLKVLTCTAALLMAAAAPAQDTGGDDERDKWYQVEVIVFERLTETATEAEAWDPDPGEPSLEQFIVLTEPGESPLEGPGPHAFHVLPAGERELGGKVEHLENAADFNPILHLAWRQPGLPKDDAPWVQLYLPPRDGEAAATPQAAATAAPGGTTGFGQDPALPGFTPFDGLPPAPPRPVLNGVFRLYLSRYLHADVDLVYDREGADTPFRMTTSRRMRSKELHYLDHPVFGVLVKVVPYEVEKSE